MIRPLVPVSVKPMFTDTWLTASDDARYGLRRRSARAG